LRELAFLNKGLTITLTDERQTDSKTAKQRKPSSSTTAAFPSSSSTSSRQADSAREPIYMEADKDQVHVEIGLQYNDAYSESVSALP